MRRIIFYLTISSFLLSSCTEKEDQRDKVLSRLQGTYYLADAIWEGEACDFNADGSTSTDLMTELRTANRFSLLENSFKLCFRAQYGLYNSEFTAGLPIFTSCKDDNNKLYGFYVDCIIAQIKYELHNGHSITYRILDPTFDASAPLVSLVEYSDGRVSFEGDTAILSYTATFLDMTQDKKVTGKVSYIYVK